MIRYCKDCFEKQQTINKLTVENERLKAQVRAQERSAREGAFGASTPSSKIPIKPNTLSERQARCGGAKPGHPGRGRTALADDTADRVERVPFGQERCPDCGEKLLSAGARRRTVTDLRAQRVEKQRSWGKSICRASWSLTGITPTTRPPLLWSIATPISSATPKGFKRSFPTNRRWPPLRNR